MSKGKAEKEDNSKVEKAVETAEGDEVDTTDVDGEEEESKDKDLDKDALRAKQDAAKITAYYNEKESDMAVASRAVKSLSYKKEEEEKKKDGDDGDSKDEKESALELKPEDVAILVDECEMSKEVAEALLKKNEGSVDAALREFLIVQ
jgi:hypothetical protein